MTATRTTPRPDLRLVRLHAERGDPHARLAQALADLEGADWGLLLADEHALARQLVALLGPGTLRVDSRLRVNREALAAAGLAVAALDGEWRGARAVWLLEPEPDDLSRAGRANVPVIVDATLAPGGQWFNSGAQLVLYRDSVTLTGHGDAPLAALFGTGRTPEPAATSPSDLSVALALRDVATLPLRLARAARTTAQLAERLGGQAQSAGPTALLLAPDAAPDTPHGLGSVMAATRHVSAGVLLTPGLDDVDTTLDLLNQPEELARPEPRPQPPTPAQRPHDRQRPSEQRRNDQRPNQHRAADRPTPPSQPSLPERHTFDAPDFVDAAPLFPDPTEETWEPEIVYSDIAQDQVKLPIPVSSGPDAPNLGDQLPNVRPDPTDTPPIIAPDLPPAEPTDGPASDLTEAQAAIYARLRDWRNQEAKRQNISRFIIASNATLALIAQRVPYTPAELREVKGMGPERMKKYGQKILEVVKG